MAERRRDMAAISAPRPVVASTKLLARPRVAFAAPERSQRVVNVSRLRKVGANPLTIETFAATVDATILIIQPIAEPRLRSQSRKRRERRIHGTPRHRFPTNLAAPES